MRRREFLRVLGGAAATWPVLARAQQSTKTARIGYLTFRTPSPADDAFFDGMRVKGWTEDANISAERRFPDGNVARLNTFARELVRLNVDVIVTAASAATQAAKDATASIPIVFVAAGDPVGQGLVQSLARPGGNVTGVSFDATPEITAKQVQLLLEAVPHASRVAVLWNSNSPFIRTYWNVVQTAAPTLRATVRSRAVQRQEDLPAAFEAMKREKDEALIVLSDSFATLHRRAIAELAASHKIPALYGHSQYVEAGGLLSYGPSLADLYRRGASYVDQILKGTKPADLPVQQPTRFELVINLKAARALGLTVPATLLARADGVIE